MRATIGLELLRRLPPAPCDIRDTKLTGFVLRVRPSGRHSYLVSLGRGKWFTLGSVETLTPADARKEARAALVDRDKGKDPIGERRAARRKSLTLDAFVAEHYEPWVLTHRKSGASTVARLRGVFGPEFGSRPLSDLNTWVVEKWRTGRLKAGRTVATVNRDVGALKAALNRGAAWKLIPPHGLADVKPLPEDKVGRLRYLSDDEEARLQSALEARDDRRREKRIRANGWRRERGYSEWPPYGQHTDVLAPIILVALHTGLRFGELADLIWGDVALDDRAMLTVRSPNAKSGRARHVPLNKVAVSVLHAWRPVDATPDARVFPGRHGERLADIKTSWGPILKAAHIADFRFHDTRHTFASRLVMAGVDLNTVRELLGHADIKMTLRYAHLAPEHKAAAVAKLV